MVQSKGMMQTSSSLPLSVTATTGVPALRCSRALNSDSFARGASALVAEIYFLVVHDLLLLYDRHRHLTVYSVVNVMYYQLVMV